MNRSPIARRYAGALFAVGRKSGVPEAEKFSAELGLLRETMRVSPSFSQLCLNPVFSAADKLKVLNLLFHRLQISAPIQNFCRLLMEKRRLVFLPAITEIFDALLDEEKGILRGELITAVKLDENQRKTAQERLAGQQAGHELILRHSVDPSLLGGVVLKMGDQVLDASLRMQFAILKEQIKRGV